MKSKILSISFILVVIAMSMTACKEKAIYKTFQTSYAFKMTVPANALISSPLFPLSFDKESNAESAYAINDTRKDLVEEVFMKSFLIEILSPQGEDLSFVNSARFYINADAEPEMLIAFKDPVPDDIGSDLSLELDAVNLAPYIRKDPFEIRSKIVTDENRTQDIVLRATIQFDVTAKLVSLN